jgi:WhiB family redox-sensing transcriptional regulator
LTTLAYKELLWEPEEGWRENAACKGIDVEVFFPPEEDVGSIFPTEESADPAREAKAICADCPVAEICLQYSLATNQVEGVWGGLDTNERRRMRRRIRDQSRRKAS